MSTKYKNKDTEIVRSWLSGNCSSTLVIPKNFATEYGLDVPCHVIVQKTPQGLLIKKLEIKEEKLQN